MNVTPSIFFSRARNLYLIISTVQFLHLIFIAELSLVNIVTWLLLFITGFVFFVGVENLTGYRNWPYINKSAFTVAFFLSFFVTMVYSRLPYLESYLSEGMYYTRQNKDLGSGGLYSLVTVFFYPLSMILAIIELKRKYVYFMALLAILLIDTLILGTRGVPVFIIVFHALFLKRKYSLKRLAPILLISTLVLVNVFAYQTESRSLTDSYDWRSTVEYSRIFDNLPVKDFYLDRQFSDSFYVGVYISQYLTHSISEFGNLLDDGSYGLTGSFNYFLDEVCLVARCDRSEYQENIEEINNRHGLYQTLYSSLLFDFGYLGLFILFLVVFMLILLRSKLSLIFLVYISMVIAFSLIDNYIYNAVGLGRFLLFVGVFYLLSFKYRIKNRLVIG